MGVKNQCYLHLYGKANFAGVMADIHYEVLFSQMVSQLSRLQQIYCNLHGNLYDMIVDTFDLKQDEVTCCEAHYSLVSEPLLSP